MTDLVDSVPGYGTPRPPIYAGTLPVDSASRAVQLFYVFTSMLANPSATTPDRAVAQGGGGASPPWGDQTGPFALGEYAGGGPSTFGMLCEKIGPFSNPDNAAARGCSRITQTVELAPACAPALPRPARRRRAQLVLRRSERLRRERDDARARRRDRARRLLRAPPRARAQPALPLRRELRGPLRAARRDVHPRPRRRALLRGAARALRRRRPRRRVPRRGALALAAAAAARARLRLARAARAGGRDREPLQARPRRPRLRGRVPVVRGARGLQGARVGRRARPGSRLRQLLVARRARQRRRRDVRGRVGRPRQRVARRARDARRCTSGPPTPAS